MAERDRVRLQRLWSDAERRLYADIWPSHAAKIEYAIRQAAGADGKVRPDRFKGIRVLTQQALREVYGSRGRDRSRSSFGALLDGVARAAVRMGGEMVPSTPSPVRGIDWSDGRTAVLLDDIRKETHDRVFQVIQRRMEEGKPARAIAREVRGFLEQREGQPGPAGEKAQYRAARLLRDTIGEFHQAGTLASILTDGGLAARWTRSDWHPARDICDQYATQNLHGLGPGVYPPRQVPDRPHPNCMCYLEPVRVPAGRRIRPA